MDSNRIIKFEKVYNFRDIGGLGTGNNHSMKSGLLFRSDELSRLTDGDIKTLNRLNLKMILDLRTPNERKDKKYLIQDNRTAVINVPIYPHREDFNRQKFIHYLSNNSDGEDFESLIKDYYQRFAFEQTGQIKKIFELLSEENNLPVLIHCSVGKDRTGFVSALIQLLAGVSRETVLEDYLMSNKFIELRTKRMIRYLRVMSLFRISAKKLKPMLEVRPDYLNDVLDKIFNDYGSVESYLTDKVGVSRAALDNLTRMIQTDHQTEQSNFKQE